jgi:hypothetical protein
VLGKQYRHLEKRDYGIVNRIKLAQDKAQIQTFVAIVMDIYSPLELEFMEPLVTQGLLYQMQR